VHDKDEVATPAQLVQNYIVTPLPEKLDMLWSFIKVRDMRHPQA
jgi:ATP-dependent RNA helicase DDX10/DBP4